MKKGIEKPVYIHYGNDEFFPDYFIHTRNNEYSDKPAAGTGLWASRVNDPNGWEAWCRRAHFKTDLKRCFKFILDDNAKVLTLSEEEQLKELPKISPWEPKDYSWIHELKPGELPTHKQLMDFYTRNTCCLDFEKLSEEYDAVELFAGAFYDSLPTWDCNSIYIMKGYVVKIVPEL